MKLDLQPLRRDHCQYLLSSANGCIVIALAAVHEELAAEMIDEAVRLRQLAQGPCGGATHQRPTPDVPIAATLS